MATYNTPGVYVREIPTLPASVAAVATAIPAFIGYTERADNNGASLLNIPKRISSLMEYEKYFGGPMPEPGITINIDALTGNIMANAPASPSNYIMYYQMQLYFSNGGGPCYIVSVGTYYEPLAPMNIADFQAGLNAVALEDEPTLIAFPDARGLPQADFYNLYEAALAQCNTLQDRFTIIDLHSDGSTPDGAAATLRNELASDYLNYGAAYYPHLRTAIPYHYLADEVMILTGPPISQVSYHSDPGFPLTDNGIEVIYRGVIGSPTVTITLLAVGTVGTEYIDFNVSGDDITITLPGGEAGGPTGSTPTQIRDAWNIWKNTPGNDPGDFEINRAGTYHVRVSNAVATVDISAQNDSNVTLEDLELTDNALFNAAKAAIAQLTVTVPPSAAIAGVYARIDRDRGVWEAPANTPLANVIAPTVKVSDAMQDTLNVDPVSGKSINAIRTFAGKGTLVWGARTLAGNDNEWRYVPTRRLFIMAEESIKKATSWAVFEPNDARTWMKVKTQIGNFLTGLWRAGALAGAKAEEAFFVNVGLGVTMDTQDILEGRMNIEIGMAAVRPAEFIILKFSHKLQES